MGRWLPDRTLEEIRAAKRDRQYRFISPPKRPPQQIDGAAWLNGRPSWRLRALTPLLDMARRRSIDALLAVPASNGVARQQPTDR